MTAPDPLATTIAQSASSGRPPPNDPRAWIMRAAGTLIGPEKLAAALKMSPRSIYYMMAGRRTVNDGVLRDTRALILLHRQSAAAINNRIRDQLEDALAEAEPAARRDAAQATAAMLRELRP